MTYWNIRKKSSPKLMMPLSLTADMEKLAWFLSRFYPRTSRGNPDHFENISGVQTPWKK